MPNNRGATQRPRLRQPFFHKTNKVSHREDVPVLTKVRPGRWLHIQHLHPAQGGQANTNCNHIKKLDHNNRGHQHVPVQENDVTLVDVDKLENHGNMFLVNLNSGDLDSTAASSGIQSLGSTCMRSDTVELLENRKSSIVPTLNFPDQNTLDVGLGIPSTVGLQSVFDRDGDTVLFFVHGVGGSSSLWYYQMQYFHEQGFEVVAPDLYGHGFSEAPRKESMYSFYELAEDVLAIFDKFCKRRNILIGHSYGSSFCAVIAREREHKVTKMILISGGGPVPLRPELCHLFCLPTCLLACLKPLLTGAFIRQAFHNLPKNMPFGEVSAFNVPSHVLRGTMRGQYWPDGNQEYHADINISVLLIYGLQDEFVSLEETEWMQETIFASTLEFVNAGHMVMLECPNEVNDLMHRFILKDMVIRPKTGAEGGVHKTVPTPNTARRKTMPHLMPGGLI